MEVRKTPRIYDPSRALYERAFHDGDTSLMFSIELDTTIENLTNDALNHTVDLQDSIEFLSNYALGTLKKAPEVAADSFTNFNRVMATASFATERFMAPFAYSLESSQLQSGRRRLADGTAGKSVDLLAPFVEHYDDAAATMPAEHKLEVRGAIQEQTVQALINLDQSGVRLAVPSTTVDDLYKGTDLYLYRYDYKEDAGYRHSISIKSTNRQMRRQKFFQPDMIVITAQDIGNLDLDISRLLIKNYQGYPGLSDPEHEQLIVAKTKVLKSIAAQIEARQADVNSAEQLKRLNNDNLSSQLVTVA